MARELAGYHCRLILTARRADQLQSLAHDLMQNSASEVVNYPGDVTQSSHRQALISAAKDEFGGLDILINNAGIGGVGTFSTANEERLRQIMEVNLLGAFKLATAFYPNLAASGNGRLVNMSSDLGSVAQRPYWRRYKFPETKELVLDGLRKAGLSE